MRKLILALLVVAIAAPAFASETRLRTLGPQVAPFIEDDANVFKWYGTLPSYANLVTITAGYEDVLFYGNDHGWYDEYLYSKFGLTYGLGEDNQYGVIGLWWEETTRGPLWQHGWFGPYGWQATDFSEWVYNKWNVMWGLSLDGLSFGLYFNRADQGYLYDEDGDEFEQHWAYTTLGLGVRFDIGDQMYADIAADYTTVGYTFDHEGQDMLNEDNNSILALRGRMFYEWSDVVTVVPYFNYITGDLSLKSDNADYYGDFDVWGWKGFHLDLGLGLNLRVNDETLLIVAVKPYGMAKAEPSGSGSEIGDISMQATMFPGFAFGFETDVKNWLTFRAGCDKMFIKWNEEVDHAEGAYEYTETLAPFNWYLGLGFHVGNFDIDAMINKEVPFSMGYWLTGFQPDWYSGAPIGMISATYHF